MRNNNSQASHCVQANSAFHSFEVDKFIVSCNYSNVDVCNHNLLWRRLVNAYEVEAGIVQVKLCDPYLSALQVSRLWR